MESAGTKCSEWSLMKSCLAITADYAQDIDKYQEL